MEDPGPGQDSQSFEQAYLGKLRLAAQVILEAAPDGNLVSDPLEVELGIFKDRVEYALLLAGSAQDRISKDLGRLVSS